MFDDMEIRQAFIELHGTDKIGAKFCIGQPVVFTRPNETYTGKVQAINRIDENDFEYLIENAPFLAWEEELKKGN